MFHFLRVEVTLVEQRVIHHTLLFFLILLEESSVAECLYFQERMETGYFVTERLVVVTECRGNDSSIYPDVLDLHLVHGQGACLVCADDGGTTHGL